MAAGRGYPLRLTLREGKPLVGSFVSIASPTVAEVMALAGFDFLVVDTEHGPTSIETAENVLRAAEVGGAASVVRVPDASPAAIARALDIGAMGVQVPGVETPEQAREVVRAAKYYPAGKRGIGLTRSARFAAVQPSTYFTRANEQTMVIVHCETQLALANLPGILQVDGVDVVYVGPFDLSQSLGAPGQVNLPQVQAAINDALDRIIASGVAAGTHALSPAHARLLIQKGVRYITLGADYLYLLHSCRNDLADARRPERPH